MNTKLKIGELVIIGAQSFFIKKIVIESEDRIRYTVNGHIQSKYIRRLCADEFWEQDFDNGFVQTY